MGKKHWIYLKRGLSADPKHRERIGGAIWCFMHIIDRADWETGIVYDWKDKDEAEDMGVNARTLRDWRQALDKNNYITCKQKQHSQEITIHNWVNPRDYSSKVLNPFPSTQFEGDILTAPLENEVQGDTQGDTQGDSKRVTPTYDSKNQESTGRKPAKKGDMLDGELFYNGDPVGRAIKRRDALEARINKFFNIKINYNRWEKFIKFADNQEIKHQQTAESFFTWLVQKPNFDLQFWPPDKMLEVWPQAFSGNGNGSRPRPPLVKAPEKQAPIVPIDALRK